MLSSPEIEASVAIVVLVVVGLVCFSIYLYGETERKRVLCDIEAVHMSGLSAEELSNLNTHDATTSSEGGSSSSGDDADVSNGDQHAGPSYYISHQLSTIPEERLSQLEEPESSHLGEADRVAAGEPRQPC